MTSRSEFWYAKVLRCLRLRRGVGSKYDLLFVAWLTDRRWLADVPRTLAPGPNATEYEYAAFPCELPRNSAMRPLAGGWHLDVVPVSAAGFRAASEPELAPLAEIALHHRVHMAPPFEHWYERRQAAAPRRGAPVTPTRFKLNTDAWI